MSDLTKDSILIDSLIRGDADSFEQVFKLYHNALFSFAFKYLQDNDMAKDVVQDAFLTLWNRRKELKQIHSLRLYLFTMVKNKVLNMIRNHNNALRHNGIIAARAEKEETDAFSKQEQTEKMLAFQKALQELKEPKKSIYRLKVEEKLKNKEIAEIMGLSVNTIKTHWSQIVLMLKNNPEISSFSDKNVS